MTAVRIGAATDREACRSYIWSHKVNATKHANGTWTYKMADEWVFNNIVRFK